MTTAAQLVQRRRVTTRARARKRPPPVPPAAPPRGAIVAYATTLHRIGRAMDARVIAAVRASGVTRPTARADGPADGDAPSIPRATIAEISAEMKRELKELLAAEPSIRTVEMIARHVATHTGQQLERQFKSVVGIDLAAAEPNLAKQLKAFRAEHLALITTMGQRKVAKVRRILEEHGAGGRVEGLAARIEAETGTTPAHAALIARSSVLSLNAKITEARHVAAGIESYTWSAVMDERTRKSHRALDGRTLRYDDPPTADGFTGHPGAIAPNCRCIADPVIDAP